MKLKLLSLTVALTLVLAVSAAGSVDTSGSERQPDRLVRGH